jgi:hypothetical protein
MRLTGVVRWVGQGLLVLAPLLAAGCLAGYVYPKVAYIPRLDVEAPPQDVWAFAVHNHREQCLSLSPSHKITLRPLPQDRTIHVQADLTLEHGYWMWGGMRLSEHVSHDLFVRLYRRGHRTVEIGSWELFEGVRWAPATSAAEREQALEALLAPPGEVDWGFLRTGEGNFPSFEHLATGSADPRHRQALYFVAGEYEALAQSPGIDVDKRNRLTDNARRLRERAGK